MFFNASCPICGGQKYSHHLSCKDYTVSNEVFQIVTCDNCKFQLTNPRPDTPDLPKYYQSNDYISHSSKTTNPIDLIYKISRYFTMMWKVRMVKRYTQLKNQTILDYGCGTGDFLAACKDHSWQTFGVEPSSHARKLAIAKSNTSIESEINQIKNNEFDAITLWHVLEHIPDLQKKLSEIKDKLAKTGTVFIAVPNHESHDAFIKRELWAGYDVPRHLWHFSQHNIRQLLDQHEMQLIAIIPMKLDAYYVSILSNKYERGKHTIPGFIKGLITGFVSNMKGRKTSNYSSMIYIARKK